MNRFVRNLRWWFWFFIKEKVVIQMNLTQAQLDQFDAAWQAAKLAAIQANVSATQAAQDAATAEASATKAAQDAADEQTAVGAMVTLADSFKGT